MAYFKAKLPQYNRELVLETTKEEPWSQFFVANKIRALLCLWCYKMSQTVGGGGVVVVRFSKWREGNLFLGGVGLKRRQKKIRVHFQRGEPCGRLLFEMKAMECLGGGRGNENGAEYVQVGVRGSKRRNTFPVFQKEPMPH